MSSSNPPFRQPPKPDPIDTMLTEWRSIEADRKHKDKQPDVNQLELMILLLKRP